MHADEAEIRQLLATWMAATRAGDTTTVLDLMTDDVVFLVLGQPPFGKATFAQMAAAQQELKIDGDSTVEEIQVHGDIAFLRSHLAVTITPPDAAPRTRAGYTLTILRREDGRWKLARDANLLVPVPPQ
jgi:uncharacterized protein (TIGR02246 family)